MHDVIEKLLILQDRDRQVAQLQEELGVIGPQRRALLARADGARSELDAAKLRVKQIESDRKKLELDVEAKKELIGKYALQQFQTKKNEEYRALSHEIDTCKAAIVQLEDEQLGLMEEADKVQALAAEASRRAEVLKTQVESQVAALDQREKALQRQLGELLGGRGELAGAVDQGVLPRYERLRKSKGDRVIVGVEHRVCGGCHMKLPTQILVSAQGCQEVINCPNCGRILYWTADMDLIAAE